MILAAATCTRCICACGTKAQRRDGDRCAHTNRTRASVTDFRRTVVLNCMAVTVTATIATGAGECSWSQFAAAAAALMALTVDGEFVSV